MAYRVALEAFEGPLDLLLYLIRKNELDIYDIPIARITEEYLACLRAMEMLNIEVAGEFAVMAATLMHIKSQMLLPAPEEGEEEGPDPREELAQRLLEYAMYRGAAEHLAERQLAMSHVFPRTSPQIEVEGAGELKLEASLFDLVDAFTRVLASLPAGEAVEVGVEEVTVEEKIRLILDKLREGRPFPLEELFSGGGRAHLIAAFLALLELVRLGEATAMQAEPFGTIFICAAPREAAVGP